MRKIMFGAVLGLVALPALASAQTAAENYSYKAPSGMFSEGTTLWGNYKFMAEDRERTARLRAGEDVTTGSVGSSSSSNGQSYPRPGERSHSYRRSTATPN